MNEKLETLYCPNNQLTSLHLNKNLQELCCSDNQLTSLHLNENLKILYCSDNQLTYLHLNEKLRMLYYPDNPIYEMIKHSYIKYNDIDKIKQRMRVLNQFRHLYYSLKFKKQFRHWLWVKIREPKIRKKYSPEYLLEHLHEDMDLDELLDNW